MSHGVISALLGGVLNVGLVLLLAPLCQGVLRKSRRVSSRGRARRFGSRTLTC